MTRYYVYNVKTNNPEERIHAFVEDPFAFAIYQFNPAKMEFSGVYVEAPDPKVAQDVYCCPKENDVFVSCDEPQPTQVKRSLFEARLNKVQDKLKKIKKDVSDVEEETVKLHINAIVYKLADDFDAVARHISELARVIDAGSKAGKMDIEEIYGRLVQKYSEQVAKLKYRSRDEDDGEGYSPA